MVTEILEQFETTNDFELGYEHIKRKTDYHLFKPEQPLGLVIYVPGFGEDAGNYRHVFCRKVAEKFQLAALSVDYHCFFNRPKGQSSIIYEDSDVKDIEKLFLVHGVPFQGKTVEEGLSILNQHLYHKNIHVKVSGTLAPDKDEYQNGGVVQALDIINAAQHAMSKYNLPSDDIILIGSSYGGYIANLAAKFAPNTFRAVFDNSSWARPHMVYIVGRDIGEPEFVEPILSNIHTKCFVRSGWTLKKGLPNSFDQNRVDIRDFSQNQIEQLSEYEPCTQYHFIHSSTDGLALTKDKITMAHEMISRQMFVHMEVMEKGDVDGVYVKTLNHGMNLSMMTFFEKSYANLNEKIRPEQSNFQLASQITYRTQDYLYQFDYSQYPVIARVLSNEC